MKQRVAIVGASDNPERFSYKAFKLLQEYGHQPLLVNPQLKKKKDELDGFILHSSLLELKEIDTVTLYVGSAISSSLKDDLLKLNPKRVIFNPGAENDELKAALDRAGIKTIENCTLVMLRAASF